MLKLSSDTPLDPESRIKNPLRYRKVPGSPAFPPPSRKREEEYIERWMERDKQLERFENGEE